MIGVTRLNHTAIVLNSDLIEYIEMTPDTVITLTTGQKMVVLETAAQVVERVVEFRRSLGYGGTCPLLQRPSAVTAEPAVDRGAHGT